MRNIGYKLHVYSDRNGKNKCKPKCAEKVTVGDFFSLYVILTILYLSIVLYTWLSVK